VLDVSKNGRHVSTLSPSEGYYPGAGQGSVGSLIAGQPVSQVSIDPGITRDVWSAVAPNIEAPSLARIVRAGNATLSGEQAVYALALLVRSYLQHPPPAQFHLIVSPLVMWIWVGGLIVVGGGLIALWPAPSTVRRRVSARVGPRRAGALARV
jgi:cytochrome c-type biogenesis protein CcmF